MRVSENIDFYMWEFGLGTILYVFSISENPYFDRAYMGVLRKSLFENNVSVSENINLRMSTFGLGTILIVFSMSETPHFDMAYLEVRCFICDLLILASWNFLV